MNKAKYDELMKDGEIVKVISMKPEMVNLVRDFDMSVDKDYHLDKTPCELLDTCQYPSIEKQVQMFVKCGQKLDVANYVLDDDVDDSNIDDIDELATILDDPDCSRQDFDQAVAQLRAKRFSSVQNKSEPSEAKSDEQEKSRNDGAVDKEVKKE